MTPVSFVPYIPSASITYQANHLNATSIELVLQLGEGTKLGSAYGCVIGRVTEQNGPAVADPLMEGLDVTLQLSVYVLDRREYSNIHWSSLH